MRPSPETWTLLNLNDLGNGAIPGISGRLGAAMAEAGGVCLESQGHAQGVRLSVRGLRNGAYSLDWPPIDDQSRRSWNDPDEATEYGAAGIAAMLAKREIGYTVIKRSAKGTGFDYWLGDESDVLTFESKAILEVSGIRKGNDGAIRARVWQKLHQTDISDQLGLPAYVIVVEFGSPVAEVQEK